MEKNKKRKRKNYRGQGSGTDVLAAKQLSRKLGMKSSAREGIFSSKVTDTDKQRSCKKGQVYSAKLKKCVVRKGQDPRFGKDRPKKAKQSRVKHGRPMVRKSSPGSYGEGPSK